MEDKQTIFFNMCHHYRKLQSAKSSLDTSKPKTFKPGKIDKGSRPISSISKCLKTELMVKKERKLVDVKKEGDRREKEFAPKILKNDVPSKLRDMRHVYYPPLKIQMNRPPKSKNSVVTASNESRDNHVDKFKRLVLDHRASSECSEDSAYNEGDCDSRDSCSPHQGVNVNLLPSQQRLENQPKVADEHSVEEAIYIEFLKDITDDILKAGVFTNRAVKEIARYHRSKNKNLDENKMDAEIDELYEKLGVPKDDNLNYLGFGLGTNTGNTNHIHVETEKSAKECASQFKENTEMAEIDSESDKTDSSQQCHCSGSSVENIDSESKKSVVETHAVLEKSSNSTEDICSDDSKYGEETDISTDFEGESESQ